MSNFALNAAWLSAVDDVSCRFVLVALADQANDDGLCWPAVDSIAQRTAMGTRTVQRALKKLVAEGHISLAGDGRGLGRGHTNRYLLHPKACPVRVAKKDARRVLADAERVPMTTVKGANDDIKGAALAPLGRYCEGIKGANDDIKGANDDIKGAVLAPEPSENPKEPKTFRAHTQEGSCPVSEAEAWDYARNLPVAPAWTQQMVGQWFSDREFRCWHTSGDNPQAITADNWRADLRRSHRWAQLAAAPKTMVSDRNLSEKKLKAAPGAEESRRLAMARRIWPDMPVSARWMDLTPEQRERVTSALLESQPQPAA